MNTIKTQLQEKLNQIKSNDLYKNERLIYSQQSSEIIISNNKQVINLCANNYLGLSNHPEIIKAAISGIEKYGYGLSSVRFICGTQDIHKELESLVSSFLRKEDTILYSSCFDANGGLFESLL